MIELQACPHLPTKLLDEVLVKLGLLLCLHACVKKNSTSFMSLRKSNRSDVIPRGKGRFALLVFSLLRASNYYYRKGLVCYV